MERYADISYDLRKLWVAGDQESVVAALAEMSPLKAAAVAIRIFCETGREASTPAQDRFLFAVEDKAKE